MGKAPLLQRPQDFAACPLSNVPDVPVTAPDFGHTPDRPDSGSPQAPIDSYGKIQIVKRGSENLFILDLQQCFDDGFGVHIQLWISGISWKGFCCTIS